MFEEEVEYFQAAAPLLVNEAVSPTLRRCPYGGPFADHSKEERRRRRRVAGLRLKMQAGLDYARFASLLCFFVTVTFRYDPEAGEALVSPRQMSDAFEAFVRRLRETRGLTFEYVRVAESTEKGVLNHYHCLFRCSSVPDRLLVRLKRGGVGLDFYQLREMWVASSGGSQGVFILPVGQRGGLDWTTSVGYLTKYVSKQEAFYHWSTSRGWLAKGASDHYNYLFKSLAVRYLADCGQFHTDASKVYRPWLEWCYEKMGVQTHLTESATIVNPVVPLSPRFE